MQLNIKDLIKEQIIYIFISFFFFVALIAGSIYTGIQACSSFSAHQKDSAAYNEALDKRNSLRQELENQAREEENSGLQKIYVLEGANFGADASFAPLFDHMLSVAKDSGIRIRSVDYNFSPKDPVAELKLDNHNVCELSATIVGKYSEIQTFIKSILSENYLVRLSQLEIVSWKRDKSVLIANIKLVFYTKTK